MAGFSASGDQLVIRLVYDGPPRSGKTTSLAALAGSLARTLESPEEAEGRTLFFDWVEYIGGSFEGLPIRCQLVSVPGQRALARRRQVLLATADVVVFVADSTAGGAAESEERLANLRQQLRERPGPPVGLVLQLNKRDQPDALPLGPLRQRWGMDGAAACVESVATESVGVREAFVLAVRLALDHVRELLASGIIGQGTSTSGAATAAELLAEVKAYEAATAPLGGTDGEHRPDGTDGTAGSGIGDGGAVGNDGGESAVPLAASLFREVLAHEDEPAGLLPVAPAGAGQRPARAESRIGWEAERGAAVPRLPDSAAPSGRVWPPVEGRILLHEAAEVTAEPQLQADGSWLARDGAWRFHSLDEHHFHDLEVARLELLRWARQHNGGLERLAPRRCLVLADGGAGSWRLWQVLAIEETLQRLLARALLGTDAAAAARTLAAVAAHLLEARARFAAEPRLPCRLGAVGIAHSRAVYTGLLPPPSWSPAEADEAGDEPDFLRQELAPVLRKVLPSSRLDVARTLDHLRGETRALPDWPRIQETLTALLIAS